MKYQVTSFSEGKKGAQITVVVGEGRNRRSFTRHLDRNGFGLNIDERAIPLNRHYEQELAEAKRKLASAETALKSLRKRLEEAEKVEPETLFQGLLVEVVIAEIGDMIAAAEAEGAEATVALEDTEAQVEVVRRELPLMMTFNRF